MLGDRLKLLRKQQKLTQKELAKKLKLSPTYISDIENGRIKMASNETLKKFSDYFGLPISYFIEDEGNPVPLDYYLQSLPEDIKEFVTDGIKNGKARPYLVLAKDLLAEDLDPNDIIELVQTMRKYIDKDKK